MRLLGRSGEQLCDAPHAHEKFSSRTRHLGCIRGAHSQDIEDCSSRMMGSHLKGLSQLNQLDSSGFISILFCLPSRQCLVPDFQELEVPVWNLPSLKLKV